MLPVKIAGESINKVLRRVDVITRNNARGRVRGIKNATRVLDEEVRSKVFPAKWANRQDNPQRFSNASAGVRQTLTSRSPVSWKSNNIKGAVRIKSYQAKVRTNNRGTINKVLLKILRQKGMTDIIERKTLKVEKKKVRWWERGDYEQAKKDPNPIITLRLTNKRPRLGRWADRGDKGYQRVKHNVAMPAIFRLLIIGRGSINKKRDEIFAALEAGALAGFDNKR